MGKILSGVLGGFSGKVGPVVGGKWKSIDYMRSYVIPANPNTPSQQTVRTKFASCIVYAKAVLTSLIQVYWDPFYSDMSGFNAWVSKNYSQLGAGNVIDSSCIMSQGSLEPVKALTTAVISTNKVVLTFDEGIVGNGLATDIMKVAYYQTNNDVLEFLNPSKTRADSPCDITPTALPEEDDVIFVFFHRGTGSSFVVSDSKAILVTT
jgi:hypothetical protein